MNDDNIDLSYVKEIVNNIGKKQENIISHLHALQKKYNYLPKSALIKLSEITQISPRTILGVATFYSQFRFKPAGIHNIKICIGTACHLKGSLDLYNHFKKILNIPENEDTDSNLLFTISKVSCLGCCMIAPAIMIDDITYGPVIKDNVQNILRDFLESLNVKKSTIFSYKEKVPNFSVIKLCLCSSCIAAGGDELYNELKNIIIDEKINVIIKTVSCTGISFKAPIIEIETNENKIFRYGNVGKDIIRKIINHHFKNKKVISKIYESIINLTENIFTYESIIPVTRYLLTDNDKNLNDFLCRQKPIVTLGAGNIAPLDYEDYIKNDGFKALSKAFSNLTPLSIIESIKESGLRGRGGGGYPTYKKWKAVNESESKIKYLICNGDEGDPGAFMDRMLMESFPFRLIEGMIIAAFACNINKGYIFVRSEYPLACERLDKALKICREKNILKYNSEKHDFQFDIELIISAGAFVCGEETALIASIEGKRGNPSLRPPYPAQKGLFGYPTLINNVETFSFVPWIILNGYEKFASIGTLNSKGTKTFALAGKINNGGLIEVEFGTTLKEIIYNIGGGVKDNKKLKAVQIGGPAGGCIPSSLIDLEIDFDSLKESGSIMGSGGMIVLDEDDCIIDTAKYFMNFTCEESCGKCTFGRIGTKRLFEILEKITKGYANDKDLIKLENLALSVKQNSLCALCGSSPNFILSSIKHFKDEFQEHISGYCRSKKCKNLIKYKITDKCIGCTKCAQKCPALAISFNPYLKHVIDESLCIKCDTCRINCPVHAIEILPIKNLITKPI